MLLITTEYAPPDFDYGLLVCDCSSTVIFCNNIFAAGIFSFFLFEKTRVFRHHKTDFIIL
jgi:hypothetical protein